jgi:hypothetical protein
LPVRRRRVTISTMTSLPTISVRHLLPLLLLTLASICLSFPAVAADAHRGDRGADRGRPIVLAKGEMSLDAAVAMVRERFGGKVISASTTSAGGKKVHVIKVLSDEGRVRTVRVDAQTGRIQ